MQRLRTDSKLDLCINSIYNADQAPLKVCYLNAGSLHRHIEDVCNDLNYLSTDVNIFSETRFSQSDHDNMYAINNYSLFRNDTRMANNRRPFSGMAVYSCIEFYPGYPYSRNSNGIEITIIRLITAPHVQIFGIQTVYRSPKVPLTQMCHALSDILIS